MMLWPIICILFPIGLFVYLLRISPKPPNLKVLKPPEIAPEPAPHKNPSDIPSQIFSPDIKLVIPPLIIPITPPIVAPTVTPAINPVKPPTADPKPKAPMKAAPIPIPAKPAETMVITAAARIIKPPISHLSQFGMSPLSSVEFIGLFKQ